MTYYLLKILSWLGIVWDLRGLPKTVREQNRIAGGLPRSK
jgi:hypothetical protein